LENAYVMECEEEPIAEKSSKTHLSLKWTSIFWEWLKNSNKTSLTVALIFGLTTLSVALDDIERGILWTGLGVSNLLIGALSWLKFGIGIVIKLKQWRHHRHRKKGS